jgi:hypothetical protein
MYQNLINRLKKILDSKATQAEKLLKISTLVDFADGLEQSPQPRPIPHAPLQPVPAPDPYHIPDMPITVDAKNPTGPGALIGVEDVK